MKKQVSFITLDAAMRRISAIYKSYFIKLVVARLNLERKEGTLVSKNELSDEGLRHAYAYVRSIEAIVNSFDKNEQLILYKDYLGSEPPLWWCDYFSRREYYLLKKNSIRKFLAELDTYV